MPRRVVEKTPKIRTISQFNESIQADGATFEDQKQALASLLMNSARGDLGHLALPNPSDGNLLHLLAQDRYSELLRHALTAYACLRPLINQANEQNMTPLMQALLLNQYIAAGTLVCLGANPGTLEQPINSALKILLQGLKEQDSAATHFILTNAAYLFPASRPAPEAIQTIIQALATPLAAIIKTPKAISILSHQDIIICHDFARLFLLSLARCQLPVLPNELTLKILSFILLADAVQSKGQHAVATGLFRQPAAQPSPQTAALALVPIASSNA